MHRPHISIVIPYYNHFDALVPCLRSISGQTYTAYDVVIVDDGSDIPLEKRRHELPACDGHLSIIRTENHGAPAARNRGFAASSGEFVIFWDADVVAVPQMLEHLWRGLEACPDAAYSYCHHSFGRKRMPAKPYDLIALRMDNYIHSTSLIRRSAVIPWDESLRRFQDWDLWLSMAEKGRRGVLVPEYLFRVIPHRGGMSTWLPSLAYRKPLRSFPWIRSRVSAYEQAKAVIIKKHHINV